MPSNEEIAATTNKALNRLTKWRKVFAARVLGRQTMTLCKSSSEAPGPVVGLQDQFELTMILRVELNALAGLLIAKGVFTAAEFTEHTGKEADILAKAYEHSFPGFKAVDTGLDINMSLANDTMNNWPT